MSDVWRIEACTAQGSAYDCIGARVLARGSCCLAPVDYLRGTLGVGVV
jgi:hypothetical protein